ncbi:GNAT family N-acetyltransferase [Demequina sp. SYSU T00039]|uniref:GNAT family N-acetyltransferase n=1 Tax=Demequina lignilytica TaxID=3051663 RepID=A0AAW7M370_9MICO|nr:MULTISPECIES: GNAT family N-acetyltransferase [unclassified Demequina]MDN4477337.1 GNAT family N-acetyltransferase [Demequina sp. SYSU T00039-1]MDN4487510.1 GNAT family N-acetyltransferase [Demequina sp. SYSU T00039]
MADDSPRMRIVMTAPVDSIIAAATPWPHVRPLQPEDIPWLAAASWEAYQGGRGFETWDAAVASTQSIFTGRWGDFMPVASPVGVTEDGYVAGVVATVQRITIDDAPDSPFVLNCLTIPDHRRQGVASGLLAAAARAAKAVGEHALGLTVDEDNAGARALYEGLGFVEVSRGPEGS